MPKSSAGLSTPAAAAAKAGKSFKKTAPEPLPSTDAATDASASASVDNPFAARQQMLADMKCKTLKKDLYKQLKHDKSVARRKERDQKLAERRQLGDAAPPKEVPKTIESTREFDETIVNPDDQEVVEDEAMDEFANYFNGETLPKLLITTSIKPVGETFKFVQDLVTAIPNATYVPRQKFDLKQIIEFAKNREFTDVMLINENNKEADGLIITHLPDGPTAHFKLSSIQIAKTIRNHARSSDHRPELVLNNFNTRLGHTVGRMFATLFPHDPEFVGRRVITFHNQRDFIFFRHHRYIFRNAQKVGLQEIGPRFTLKLRSLQKGTFDAKYGEYEWTHKRGEMDTSRRRFFL
ncbi:hypothetical protein CAOG_09134 [Capsaspora owczarzaki ATCC 30864]|uniref:Brix domain-containing protein n=1 Tax=Capsaspora owczarzaki (strain ATCC 30864) TaxID=595528 RepID=A0A0D2W0P8_CAPO3|nr:hypothetical protein CAOG_09134 [Capsaspora owczarzaki ATCC 30864]KJE97812.1 hypothetical protein CAOG_009134 [Capsaspora owczarzaki ATCC 30864]|eukprot:XP_011270844.1 hypothetical protein CAOG_09134 [Capsaspora owczarzaki ATCC 30864]